MDDNARSPDAPAQTSLPFDDEADRPIPFTLTARARRSVAPEGLPSLRLVGGQAHPGLTRRSAGAGGDDAPDLDRPDDTRPSRARALRRAGVSVGVIARQLDVDDLLVRAWVGDVAVHPTALHPSTATPARSTATAETDRRAAAADALRDAARVDAAHRLAVDPRFAAGLGVVAGVATVDAHAVTLRLDDTGLAGLVGRWLREHTPADQGRVRVVLRLGAEVSGDVARHRWSQALGLEPERVASTRWRSAPSTTTVEALVRVADPAFAATLTGWLEALVAPTLEGVPAF